MRSNRPNYASTPAGSAKALDQKPKPKRSKREINQLMLTLFFIVLPVLGLLAIFFQPMRWAFMIVVVAAVAVMWVIHAFLFPGRMILTAVYGLLMVFTLVNALSASHASSIRPAQTMLVPTLAPVATDVPFASYSTMGTSVPDLVIMTARSRMEAAQTTSRRPALRAAAATTAWIAMSTTTAKRAYPRRMCPA